MTISVTMTVNGQSVTRDVEPRTLLVQFLRDHLNMTGTHVGCDTSQCGACVVHVNGNSVKSCTILAAQAQAPRSPQSRAWPRTASCIRCKKPSANITPCNAASARRA